MFEESIIDESDGVSILNRDESHFFDVTSKEGDGRTVQKKCCSFANSDGGEIFIGIIDKREPIESRDVFARWNGFKDHEEANSFITNIFSNIEPQLSTAEYEFLIIKNHKDRGKVLKVSIEKSPLVHKTSNDKVFVRKGAQCLEIVGDSILSLQMSKGVISSENQAVGNYDLTRLYESKELHKFLQDYAPKTDPSTFLKKQLLVLKANGDKNPTCAGVLLYDECPSAVLPKKCSVKISRYTTSEQTPEREHLERQETIEGPLYEQIDQSIRVVQSMIESVPVMGVRGLEKAKYPPEAIKEVLVNALIHRDYNLSDDVIVLVFNNRIEIHSPGILAGPVTIKNILNERFARNPKIVRLLNKYPDPPNKDIGEGLNTAFQKMKEVRLKDPIIEIQNNKVVVTLPHQTLASPEEQILKYLEHNKEISNSKARELTGVKSENAIKGCFYKLRDKDILERVPNKLGINSAWRLVETNTK